jgi:hypothetical protein
MPAQREISGKAFVRDLHAGLSDAKLMEKYKLKPTELSGLFKQLLDAGIMKPADLYGRSVLQDYAAPTTTHRILPREDIDFPLAIYEAKTKTKGFIRDLTAEGVGIKGIAARVDEVKTFVVPAREFFGAGRVVFEAKCRWMKNDAQQRTCMTGFEILKVIEGNMNELLNCIGALSYAERAVLRHQAR